MADDQEQKKSQRDVIVEPLKTTSDTKTVDASASKFSLPLPSGRFVRRPTASLDGLWLRKWGSSVSVDGKVPSNAARTASALDFAEDSDGWSVSQASMDSSTGDGHLRSSYSSLLGVRHSASDGSAEGRPTPRGLSNSMIINWLQTKRYNLAHETICESPPNHDFMPSFSQMNIPSTEEESQLIKALVTHPRVQPPMPERNLLTFRDLNVVSPSNW